MHNSRASLKIDLIPCITRGLKIFTSLAEYSFLASDIADKL
jgi:hypothetical protein